MRYKEIPEARTPQRKRPGVCLAFALVEHICALMDERSEDPGDHSPPSRRASEQIGDQPIWEWYGP